MQLWSGGLGRKANDPRYKNCDIWSSCSVCSILCFKKNEKNSEMFTCIKKKQIRLFPFLNSNMGNQNNFRALMLRNGEGNKLAGYKKKSHQGFSGLNVVKKQPKALNFNTWEDQLVEEAACDWEAFCYIY